MKLVGGKDVHQPMPPSNVLRTEPWGAEMNDLWTAIKSLARTVAELQEEIRAMKGHV